MDPACLYPGTHEVSCLRCGEQPVAHHSGPSEGCIFCSQEQESAVTGDERMAQFDHEYAQLSHKLDDLYSHSQLCGVCNVELKRQALEKEDTMA